MNAFVEKGTAFRGPFGQKSVPMATSTRTTPIAGIPGPTETEIPISQLPLAGVTDGSEQVAIVQNGVTCRTTVGSFSLFIPDAPSDSQYYSRRNAAWVVPPSGLADAPNDGTAYARKSAVWAHLTHADITDWTATLAPYALIASSVASFNTRTGAVTLSSADVTGALTFTPYNATNPSGYQTAAQVTAVLPVASSTSPLMDGTAAVGAGATFARADHIHPSDTSRYAATNPSGFQTAANVTASLAPYALTSAVPLASATTPLINGTAAVGVATAWSRGDHVHPTDTTRYAASNPSGFQTAAQVTTSLGAYLPLAGGTLTGNLNGTTATFSGALTSAVSLTVNVASGVPGFYLQKSAATAAQIYVAAATTDFYMHNIAVGTYLSLDAGANFNYNGGTGVAYKTGGGSWTAPSDARIKTVRGDYQGGLDEVMRLRPVSFVYKGNDTLTDEPDAVSPHAFVAAEGKEFVGLVAQELEQIFPDMVHERAGFIDGAAADIKNVDSSALIYALVNAVKTLSARVTELEAARG